MSNSQVNYDFFTTIYILSSEERKFSFPIISCITTNIDRIRPICLPTSKDMQNRSFVGNMPFIGNYDIIFHSIWFYSFVEFFVCSWMGSNFREFQEGSYITTSPNSSHHKWWMHTEIQTGRTFSERYRIPIECNVCHLCRIHGRRCECLLWWFRWPHDASHPR